MCRRCAGLSPADAAPAFRARVEELGGTVLEPVWLGANAAHRVRCAAGHETRPYPTSLQQGGGLCRVCAGKAWDRFYVVAGLELVKLGITSGDPRPRLARHARAGAGEVLRLLAVEDAAELERAALAALELAGWRPVLRREWFDRAALAVVLDVAESLAGGGVDAGRCVPCNRSRRREGVT
jgi:hypothetical protein